MTKDPWLPKGYTLPDGSKTHSLLMSGEKWQIYECSDSGKLLIALPKLGNKWIDSGLIEESLLIDIPFGEATYSSLTSRKGFALEALESANAPDSKMDAIAFSLALKESRRISSNVSFHDAVYVDQYSRLLPTWTLTPQMDDEMVLGIWITGGVEVSTKSFRRLSNLTGWMPLSDLAEIVATAGFHTPPDVDLLTKGKPISGKHSSEKITDVENGVQSIQTQSNEDRPEPKLFKLSGRPILEKFFNEHIIDIIFNAEKYRALGIEFPSAIVLHGPPGCGKSFAVARLVEFIDWPNYSIDSHSVGSPYIHETGKKISEVFNNAMDTAPSVVVIDEMELFLSDRRSGGTFSLHHVEEVAEFLKRIPEAIKNRVLIFAMTNLIELIDPAILRRGRFDHIIEVGMPSRVEVTSLLDSLLEKLPKSNNLNLESALGVLTGKPLSDAAFVIREAARLAAKVGKSEVDQDSLTSALKSLPEEKEDKAKQIGFVPEP